MRYLTLLIATVLCFSAIGQTTQPATQPAGPEDLKALFQPYAERIKARVAELPNVPTQAQMDACKEDCDAIGDEFEQAVKWRWITYTGNRDNNPGTLQAINPRDCCSAREAAMNRTLQPDRPPTFAVTQTRPTNLGPGRLGTIKGQVAVSSVSLFIKPDNIKNGRTDISTTVAYPVVIVSIMEDGVFPAGITPAKP